MDIQQGLLCSLTGAKADFQDECQNYTHDSAVQERLDSTTPLAQEEVHARLDEGVLHQLRMEQNLAKGGLAALAAGVLGAAIWAVITVATEYQIGFMALAIGAMVGFAMRFAGKGVDQVFGIVGAFIAVASCFLGNFLSIIGFGMGELGTGFFETLLIFDYAYFFPVMAETFSPIDLLFYGIAGYEGYKFSFRSFTEEDIARLHQTGK